MNLIQKIKHAQTQEYWMIAYRKRNGAKHFYDEKLIQNLTLISHKRYLTYADPFLFEWEGETWLFYEKQNLGTMHGELWCQNLDNRKSKPCRILKENFHLSYPQIFRIGKTIYMIPESRNADAIRLYICRKFPDKWEFTQTIKEIPAVDTTYFYAEDAGEGFFFTYKENCLYIYEASLEKDRPVMGECLYQSPIDKTKRPGGFLFQEEEMWLRPSQYCENYYGEELIFQEILHFPNAKDHIFLENEYARIKAENIMIPGRNIIGIHTYNQTKQYEVIDVLCCDSSPDVLLRKIFWVLREKLFGKH